MGCYIYNCVSINDIEWGLNTGVKNLLAENVKIMLTTSVPTLVHVRYRLSPTISFAAVDFADWISTSAIGAVFSLQVTCLFGSVGSTLAMSIFSFFQQSRFLTRGCKPHSPSFLEAQLFIMHLDLLDHNHSGREGSRISH